MLAAAATAAYLAARQSASAVIPRTARLTVISEDRGRIRGRPASLAAIAVVDTRGRLRTVWTCPKHIWCGDLTSIAWSPNGRRLAMTLGEIGGTSGYVGLHVIDEANTGADAHLGSLPIPNIERSQPTPVLQRLVNETVKKLGCPLPHQVAWAPDSKRLAYVCGDDLLHGGEATTIYLINANGSDRRRLRTGTQSAYWPSWSPDGTRIAFATAPLPYPTFRHDTKSPAKRIRSDVYTTRTDGSDLTLLARAGSAPSWSPDGKLIAYEARCGIRLVTPKGNPRIPYRCARAPTSAAPASRSGHSTVRSSPSGLPMALGGDATRRNRTAPGDLGQWCGAALSGTTRLGPRRRHRPPPPTATPDGPVSLKHATSCRPQEAQVVTPEVARGLRASVPTSTASRGSVTPEVAGSSPSLPAALVVGGALFGRNVGT